MKLSKKGRRIFRTVLNGLGLATASLSLNACMYGMPPDMYGPAPEYGMPGYVIEDLLLRGEVRSAKTGLRIPGIAVWIKDVTVNWVYTVNEDGTFYFYVPVQDEYTLIFTDIDGIENGGNFKQKTITLTKEQCIKLLEEPLIVVMEEIDEE